MKFRYRCGQRPLDGYTIKRGVGAGGFGEVYFALSDAGKEVALKLILAHTDTEIRGVAQCLNFKHPHLVHLYDLRRDSERNRWLVMEYVQGESLDQAIRRHPHGLPEPLAREWFLAIADAVHYLHDHGVVHRDLKPANIFIEHGNVKIGDYGLCKAISESQQISQTQHVGTVQYMAPEIGKGEYNRTIDVYSCGVILYEMLSGKLPFHGDTASEILMKHLTTEPDLEPLPEAYRPIVRKALAKAHAQRYSDLGQMAAAVRQLHEATSTTSLTMETSPGRQLGPPPTSRTPTPMALPTPSNQLVERPVAAPLPRSEDIPVSPERMGVRSLERLVDLSGSLAGTAILAGLAPLASVLFFSNLSVYTLGWVYVVTLAMCWAVQIPSRLLWVRPRSRTSGRRMLMGSLGVLVGLTAYWIEGWGWPRLAWSYDLPPLPERSQLGGFFDLAGPAWQVGLSYPLFFALLFAYLNWWHWADRHRKHRFALYPTLATLFWTGLLWLVWDWVFQRPPVEVLLIAPLAAAIVQLTSPWTPPPPPKPRRYRLRLGQ